MARLFYRWVTGDDTASPKTAGDIRKLCRLLEHRDLSVRWRAADALASSGRAATGPLLAALESPDSLVRLCAVEVLGALRSPDVVPALACLLRDDQSIDVRWAAAVALGETGDPGAVPSCIGALKDPSRYVRYGAARALGNLGWDPPDEFWRAYYFIALQDWGTVSGLGKAAAGPLREMLNDDDPSVRMKVIDLLSLSGTPEAADGCASVLSDPHDNIRYRGVLSAIKCGLSAERLPLLAARRERTGPDPAAAALLNFLFLGIGYNYIGKWWGFLAFMSYMTILLLAQLQLGPFLPYLIAYPLTAVFAVHTYYEAKEMAGS